ncbi:MAG: dihydroorotate dehydrogenase electron transfer subunit [Candidatus Zixiibacteriota bacterium]
MIRIISEDVTLIAKRDLHNNYYSVALGPFSRAKDCRPGQFVHVQMPNGGVLFRRAFSVASVDPKRHAIEIIFRVFGRGTRALGKLKKGDSINILGPLGVPFAQPGKKEIAVMVAGGIGFPPLLFHAESLVKSGFNPKRIFFYYGGRGSADIIERPRIKKLGVTFVPATQDGSLGQKGLITKPLDSFLAANAGSALRIYGCGPEGMLKAVNELAQERRVAGQLSLEAPMPCGVGICLGCVVPLTNGGYARVCYDGPVFNIGEVAL